MPAELFAKEKKTFSSSKRGGLYSLEVRKKGGNKEKKEEGNRISKKKTP